MGYLFGHPIAYEFDESGEASNAKLVKQLIEGFNTENNIADEDSEWGKWPLFAVTAPASLTLTVLETNV